MMKHIYTCTLFFFLFSLEKSEAQQNYVQRRGHQFTLNGKPYYYIGTNYWYGSVLALQTDKARGIDRLRKELNFLKSKGINNLRVMAGAEGSGLVHGVERVGPPLQTAKGKFNADVLNGLDILLQEMGKREMKAILFFSNNWEWSGGFLQYLRWNNLIEDSVFRRKLAWDEMRDYVSKFYTCEPCKADYLEQVEYILNHTNKRTGKKYTADPTIMTWELANEPRPMRPASNVAYKKWISDVAAFIKLRDKNHLVTTGHEGEMGTESLSLFEEVHADKNIDYLTIHIWPKNWAWFKPESMEADFPQVISKTKDYINKHIVVAEKLSKPLVIEEFGLPRDHHSFDITSATTLRNQYYDTIFSIWQQHAKNNGALAGANFWAFNGMARPIEGQVFWKKGDDYMGDPPMEEQGLNGVFDTDTLTWNKISSYSLMARDAESPPLADVGETARVSDFIKTSDGIIVRPHAAFGGNAKEVQLTVIADNIIRITATADKNLIPNKSLIVTAHTKQDVKWNTTNTKTSVTLKTAKLTAIVNLQTGAVSFYDVTGKKIIVEKELGRSLQPQIFEGERLYSIRQDFVTAPDDAWYGLGQHQDELMNYKGYQVQLFQNNTEVAVPFLVSKKNYGILWDNYSLTQFGDVRPYQPLNALKIFSKTGEQGWLTASYGNDKTNPSDVVVQKAESSISYEFLNHSKLFLPKEFKPNNGIATWEGSVASGSDGIHKFRFTYAGYAKVWVDDKLVLDRWRQAWNPGSAILDVDLQKGKKHTFKVEWIPNGGESYLSFKWLPPLTEEEKNSFSFSSEAGKSLDYYFIYGQDMDGVIAGYRKLTGKAVMLPKWAFGKWQSRERYKTQKEILEVADEFRKRKIPFDNIVLDWSYWKEAEWGSQNFDETRFSAPDSMIDVLHKKYNTRFMISVWPKFYEGTKAYQEFDNSNWLYKRNVADKQKDWIAQGYTSTFYDAFNEGAQKGFWNLINQKLYKKGVDAWWMDASEPDILSNVTPQKRKEQMSPTALGAAALYLNAYPLQNAKGIYEGQRTTNPSDRVFILTRSAFAGLQRYAAATWSGDIASRWHDMKAQISAGVNFSMSGVPYWTMDIGGFAVEQRFERPNEKDLEEWRELQTRWYQFGAFVPLFRVHGQFPYREIFNIAPESHPAYQSMLYYDKLRYRLLPYIYSLAGGAYHNNGTIMRGLVMDFPTDTAVTNLNDQYLFGPSLLISPVYNYQQRTKEIYLPKGKGWYNIYNGQYNNGGKKISAEATYERMPVFVKAGSVLPFGPELQYSTEKPADEITLYIYTGADGSFNLYEDEGTNYNYEKGAFAIIPIQYHEATKTVTMGDRKGSFNGMLQQRKFNIVWVSKDNKVGIDAPHEIDKTVLYSGKAIAIKK